MKKYFQFINEMHGQGPKNPDVPLYFNFAIDLRGASPGEIEKVKKEFRKYIEIKTHLNDYLGERGVWCWMVETSSWFDNISIGFAIITTPNWGLDKEGIKVTDSRLKNMVTVDEFLAVGLKGIKDFVEIKDDLRNYNL